MTTRASWTTTSVTTTITLDGEDVTSDRPRDLHGKNVAYVPADRHRFGLVLSFPLTDNAVLTDYYMEPYSHGVIRDDGPGVAS